MCDVLFKQTFIYFNMTKPKTSMCTMSFTLVN